MTKLYVQYGCGLSAPQEWINFDASPMLRIQKIPVIGKLLGSRQSVTFPANVRYGDIIKGLPVKEGSCDGIYCSHVLEHLSLADFRIALKNTYRMLKPGGTFRCVVPDLEQYARDYLSAIDSGDASASIAFVGTRSLLGMEKRPRGIAGLMRTYLGNAHHRWMWDHHSMEAELRHAGFSKIRRCRFNDSADHMFTLVEDASRFEDAVAMECLK